MVRVLEASSYGDGDDKPPRCQVCRRPGSVAGHRTCLQSFMNAAYRSDTAATALEPVVWPTQPRRVSGAVAWLRDLLRQPAPPPRSTLQTGLHTGEFHTRNWL